MTSLPMLVGLCGRSGSGKGYVSEIFRERGIPSVDTDAVYRLMTSPSESPTECMLELVREFGEDVMNHDNSLNRAAMREIVFSGNTEALNALNRITHAHILKKTIEEANLYASLGYEIVLIDAPLLFESGFDSKCSKVIAVCASEETVIRRIMRRDGIDRESAEKRLRTQKSVSELREKADFIIENNGDDEAMIGEIDACIAELKKILKENGNN